MRRHLKSVTTLIFRTAILVLVFFLFQIPGSTASAQDNVNLVPASDSTFAKEHKQKKAESFNPGDMIMEHVVDNHEWHILEIGHFELTVPLPVILYYDGKLYTFCSSRFHNEEHAYQGFSLPEAGPDKGKIVRTSAIPAEPKVYDFSITKTVLAIMISALLMLLIFISIARAYANNRNKAPKGIQSMLEPLIIFIRDDIAKSSIGEKKYEKYMPYLLTIFFFIFLNNILGLIPIISTMGIRGKGSFSHHGTPGVFTISTQ